VAALCADGKTCSMTDPDRDPPGPKALQGEAQAWLMRLTSGTATPGDIEAFDTWRARSPAHRQAFAEAALLWNVLGEATRHAAARNPALAAAAASPPEAANPARRAFMAGGMAGGGLLAASLAGVAVVRPPFGLWPSWSELAAEYRTRKGEQRRIEIAGTMAVQINTQTSIDLRPAADGATRIELISGEAAFATQDVASPDIVVIAGNGRARARRASFNVRKDASSVVVSCIDGEVQVSCERMAVLGRGQQAIYDQAGLGPVDIVDPEAITAWQRGLLIFRDESLSRVIAEVNRYRAGRIVLLDSKLGQRRIIANFRLDRIDDVVDFVAQVVHAPVRWLPGGIVLLG
jgi:transmembrane sensor